MVVGMGPQKATLIPRSRALDYYSTNSGTHPTHTQLVFGFSSTSSYQLC